MRLSRLGTLILVLIVSAFIPDSGVAATPQQSIWMVYRLDDDSAGWLEKLGNLYSLGVVSNDPNVLKAEYEAGFIQGRLQRDQIANTRDNIWDSIALTDPGDPKTIPPSKPELDESYQALTKNYAYTLSYIRKLTDRTLKQRMTRLIFRLLGIYHGATRTRPQTLRFDGTWLPALDWFKPAELRLNYQTRAVSFLDVYFLNAAPDLMDVIDNEPPGIIRCSAFVKRTPSDVFLTHNSWWSFLDQSMAATYWINGTYLTLNSLNPGSLGSNTDFGYNDKGLIFNETTMWAAVVKPRVESLWMYFRGILAEQFAGSLDEFYRLVSLESSNSYMNGYAIVDSKTREIGLVEMANNTFVYFKSDRNGRISVTTKPKGISTAYDKELFQPNVIIQVNFPASLYVREQLKSIENRPERRKQFLARMGTVTDIETAKALIIYTAPDEPLSIYGRWDLGYGTTPKPKTIPDGSIDAKAVAASMIGYVRGLRGVFDANVGKTAFWMKYGTAVIDGKPFIWNQSKWKTQKLRGVPNVLSGDWVPIRAYIR